jgi:hypothetical protein
VFLNKCYFYCILSRQAEFPNYPKIYLSEIGSAPFISVNVGSTVFLYQKSNVFITIALCERMLQKMLFQYLICVIARNYVTCRGMLVFFLTSSRLSLQPTRHCVCPHFLGCPRQHTQDIRPFPSITGFNQLH